VALRVGVFAADGTDQVAVWCGLSSRLRLTDPAGERGELEWDERLGFVSGAYRSVSLVLGQGQGCGGCTRQGEENSRFRGLG
jgi:hypothetical protein